MLVGFQTKTSKKYKKNFLDFVLSLSYPVNTGKPEKTGGKGDGEKAEWGFGVRDAGWHV